MGVVAGEKEEVQEAYGGGVGGLARRNWGLGRFGMPRIVRIVRINRISRIFRISRRLRMGVGGVGVAAGVAEEAVELVEGYTVVGVREKVLGKVSLFPISILLFASVGYRKSAKCHFFRLKCHFFACQCVGYAQQTVDKLVTRHYVAQCRQKALQRFQCHRAPFFRALKVLAQSPYSCISNSVIL